MVFTRFLRTKEGRPSFLLCRDYQKLNAVTVSDSNSIQRMAEFIYLPSDARVFSTLEANADY